MNKSKYKTTKNHTRCEKLFTTKFNVRKYSDCEYVSSNNMSTVKDSNARVMAVNCMQHLVIASPLHIKINIPGAIPTKSFQGNAIHIEGKKPFSSHNLTKKFTVIDEQEKDNSITIT